MATRGRAVTDPTMGGWETSFTSSLRSRSKALKGGMASRESLFAAGGNAVNPMVVSRAQQTCTVVVEQAVGVVRNHEDGTWSAPGRDDPKASRWQHRRTGSGLYERARRRGDLWKTPREEFRCRRHRNARTRMRRESGAEGQEGGFDRMLTYSVVPVRRSSKVPVVP